MAESAGTDNVSAFKRLYFAGHHFTRDFIGNVAPLTAISVAFVLYYEPARMLSLAAYKNYVSNISFWGFVIFVVTYAICAYFVGAIANIGGNLLHRVWQKMPGIGKKASYNYWYKLNTKDIDDLYDKFFPELKMLVSGASVSPTDKVNILKEYFRKNNPGGYVETYRQFLKVDIVRTTVFYAIGLSIFSISHVIYNQFSIDVAVIGFGSTFLAALLMLGELPRRVRKVVRAEYQFIIATAQMKRDAEVVAAAQ